MSDFQFFTDFDLIDNQPKEDAFGEIERTVFANSQSYLNEEAFNLASMHKAKDSYVPNVYAICDGEVIVVPVINSNMVNIILKPENGKQPQTGLPYIKFFIYRGVLASSIYDLSTSGIYSLITIDNKAIPNDKYLKNLMSYVVDEANPSTIIRYGRDAGVNILYNNGNNLPAEYSGITLDDLFFSRTIMKVQVKKGCILGEFVTDANKNKGPVFNSSHNNNSLWHTDQGYFGLEIIQEHSSFSPVIEDVRNILIEHSSISGQKVNTHNRNIVFEKFDKSLNRFVASISGSTERLDYYKINRNKERILNYIDPCAFWGSFITYEKKFSLDCRSRFCGDKFDISGDEIYENVLLGYNGTAGNIKHRIKDRNVMQTNFFRINSFYVDIRNEYNDSYNYNMDKYFPGLYDFDAEDVDKLAQNSLLIKGIFSQSPNDSIAKNRFYLQPYSSKGIYSKNLMGNWPILRFELQRLASNDSQNIGPQRIWINDEEHKKTSPTMIANSDNDIAKNSHFCIEMKLNSGYKNSYDNAISINSIGDVSNRVFLEFVNEDNSKNTKQLVNDLSEIYSNGSDPEQIYVINQNATINEIEKHAVDQANQQKSETIKIKVYTTNVDKTSYVKNYIVSNYLQIKFIRNSKTLSFETYGFDFNGDTITEESTNVTVLNKNVSGTNFENAGNLILTRYEFLDSIFLPNELKPIRQGIVDEYPANQIVINDFENVSYVDFSRFYGIDYTCNQGIVVDSNLNRYFYLSGQSTRINPQTNNPKFGKDTNSNSIQTKLTRRIASSNQVLVDYLLNGRADINRNYLVAGNNNPLDINKKILVSSTAREYVYFIYFGITSIQYNSLISLIQSSIDSQQIDSIYKVYLGFKIVNVDNSFNTSYRIVIRGYKSAYNSTSSKLEIKEVQILSDITIGININDGQRLQNDILPVLSDRNAKSDLNYGYSVSINRPIESSPELDFVKLESTTYFLRSASMTKYKFMEYINYVRRSITRVWSNYYLGTTTPFGNRGLYSALTNELDPKRFKYDSKNESLIISGTDSTADYIENPKLYTELTEILNCVPSKLSTLHHLEIIANISNTTNRSNVPSNPARILNLGVRDIDQEVRNIAAHEYGHILGLVDRYGYFANYENANNSADFGKIILDSNSVSGSAAILDLSSSTGENRAAADYVDSEPLYNSDYKWVFNLMSTQRHVGSPTELLNLFFEKQFIDRYFFDGPESTNYFKKIDGSNAGNDIITVFLTDQQFDVVFGHGTEFSMASNQGVFLFNKNDTPLTFPPVSNPSDDQPSKSSFMGIYDFRNGALINTSDYNFNANSALPANFTIVGYSPDVTLSNASNLYKSPSEYYTFTGTSGNNDGKAINRIAPLVSSNINSIFNGRVLSIDVGLPGLSQIDEVWDLLTNNARESIKTNRRNINGDNIVTIDVSNLYRLDINGRAVWMTMANTFTSSPVQSNMPLFFNSYEVTIRFRLETFLDNKTFLDASDAPKMELRMPKHYFLNRYVIIDLIAHGFLNV